MAAPRFGSGSVLFGTQPVAAVATAQAHTPADFDFVAHPDAKNRMTFIVLGVLLGALGAHNFYAGYRGKAIAQLCISVLTLGFASPMSWIWAVIDVWTIDQDHKGIKFKS
jgi:TM2 domain-containing membrane protein YozV